MLGQSEVIVRVTLVPDEPEEVKTGEEGSRQLDVGLGGLLDVVATESRIGSCQDRHTSIEGRHDASLGGKKRNSLCTGIMQGSAQAQDASSGG